MIQIDTPKDKNTHKHLYFKQQIKQKAKTTIYSKGNTIKTNHQLHYSILMTTQQIHQETKTLIHKTIRQEAKTLSYISALSNKYTKKTKTLIHIYILSNRYTKKQKHSYTILVF